MTHSTLHVFPNPAKDEIHFLVKQGAVINIYNSCGQLITTFHNNESNLLNTGNWNKGLYFFSVAGENATGKFILE
jgi:hypothetical protein